MLSLILSPKFQGLEPGSADSNTNTWPLCHNVRLWLSPRMFNPAKVISPSIKKPFNKENASEYIFVQDGMAFWDCLLCIWVNTGVHKNTLVTDLLLSTLFNRNKRSPLKIFFTWLWVRFAHFWWRNQTRHSNFKVPFNAADVFFYENLNSRIKISPQIKLQLNFTPSQ